MGFAQGKAQKEDFPGAIGDDLSRTFLIAFGSDPPTATNADEIDDAPFILSTPDQGARREVKTRQGQQRFKFRVFKRYGPQCVVCGLAVAEMLDAAHICPKLAEGSDDPRNGLVLCANHHRAFDAELFAIDPASAADIASQAMPTVAGDLLRHQAGTTNSRFISTK
jgi:hypothetical protein